MIIFNYKDITSMFSSRNGLRMDGETVFEWMEKRS
jgi:hypothetical protein